MERKLVAILSADVVGYTRLMEIDEAGTLARLKALRQRLIDPRIAAHGGRIVKLMGDGALVEFPSVIAAVDCAIAIQGDMSAAEPDLPDESRIRFRIGINVGDVIVDGDDIYGEGVNIASRLQTLAEPGAVAVSAAVREHVGSKLPVAFEDFGAHSVKNLEKPVRVYMARLGSSKAAGRSATALTAASTDRLSIAILPFVNMSSDAEQEYFADGITEDIITELSRFKSLFVIARNSTFHYKGQSPKIQDVGRDLAVRWVVEGSVRKLGNRVRITAQLIDAATGAHLWAERYDRTLEDIFEVQDEVVRSIAAAIPGYIDRAATEHVHRKPPANLTAFDHLLKARWLTYHAEDDHNQIVGHLTEAIAADPTYALAHALLANAYTYSIYVIGADPDTAITRGAYHAARAVTLDDGDPEVHAVAASNYNLSGNHELADFHSRRAVELNPNDSTALRMRGVVVSYLGRQEEAMDLYTRAQKLDPNVRETWYEPFCDCLFMQGKYDQVLAIIHRWHAAPTHMKLVQAAAYALLGRAAEARAALAAFDSAPQPRIDPQVLVKYQMRMLARQEDRDRWLEGYRKAGLDV
jgi:adenylate cyclase